MLNWMPTPEIALQGSFTCCSSSWGYRWSGVQLFQHAHDGTLHQFPIIHAVHVHPVDVVEQRVQLARGGLFGTLAPGVHVKDDQSRAERPRVRNMRMVNWKG